jgi:hypothetical protein
MSSKTVAKIGQVALYVSAFVLPVLVFFHDRGGAGILQGLPIKGGLQVFFSLLGLYAFTLVTFQVLIATNRCCADCVSDRLKIYQHKEYIC